jgi:hypothetical protein
MIFPALSSCFAFLFLRIQETCLSGGQIWHFYKQCLFQVLKYLQPGDEARNGETAYRSGLELYPPGGPASALALEWPRRAVRSTGLRASPGLLLRASSRSESLDPVAVLRCCRYLVFVLSRSGRSRFPLVSETKGNLTAPMIDGVSNPTRPTNNFK